MPPFYFVMNIFLSKARSAAVFSWWGQLTKFKGPNIHPAVSVDHPLKPVENLKQAISSWITRRNKSLNIAYHYFSISNTTSYLFLFLWSELTRYCDFRGGPLAQQGVYLAPSNRLTGTINWKPKLFWPLTYIFLWKKK